MVSLFVCYVWNCDFESIHSYKIFIFQREQKQSVEEPGPPSRPALPQRLIVIPDPPQHANRPLPPTPKCSSQAPPQQIIQQQQRNSQNMFKPIVSNIYHSMFMFHIFSHF